MRAQAPDEERDWYQRVDGLGKQPQPSCLNRIPGAGVDAMLATLAVPVPAGTLPVQPDCPCRALARAPVAGVAVRISDVELAQGDAAEDTKEQVERNGPERMGPAESSNASLPDRDALT